MEYQFTHTMHGVIAKCEMDFEAFAHWLNNEIAHQPHKLDEILAKIEASQRAFPNPSEWHMEGREYSLYVDTDEVMVKANNFEDIFNLDEEMEEGFNLYNQESIAFCGLEDFEKLIRAYLQFLKTYH